MESSKSRIVYVEPNFVNGLTKNGVDLSVPLDDLCISVDLIAEVVDRNAVVSDSNIIINNLNSSKISFFNGIQLDKSQEDTFLSTYFTNITYEDSKEKGIVEGLGISSINISFDSWYMPIVSINFVDVRGSSIFSPNEYNNENKKTSYVTSDKIFKCFFTFPYPKFKLIVKGFYGSPVTFTLACSKFNGRFNSNNGNFEATASFVGYNYSLLTDINFQYLLSATQDEYYGKKYFDSKKNSPEWVLSGGEEVPRLKDLIPMLKKADGIIDEILNTDKTSIKNRENLKEREMLENIKNSYNQMINEFEKFSNLTKILENSEEIVYGINYGDNDTMTYEMSYTNSFVKAQNNFINSVKKYNEDPLFKSKSFKRIANGYDVNDKLKFGDKFYFSKCFSIKYNNGKIESISAVDSDGQINIGKSINNVLKNRIYNNNRKFSNESISKIVDFSNKKNNKLKTHVYIFKKYNFLNDLNNKINECIRFDKENQKNISKLIDKSIKLSIGFNPTVGNICKIIFAHLDTFLNSIFRCMENISSEIKNGERKFSDFGLSISQTDLSYNEESGNNILAFPMVVNSSDDELSVNQWIGDFNPDSQECQLINGYVKSSVEVKIENEKLSSEINNEGVIEDFCQINPCDFSYSRSPFKYTNIDNDYLIDFIAHVGIRSSYLFGIMSNTSSNGINLNKMLNISSIMGELDAYNFYLRNIEKNTIKSEILDKIGTGNSSIDKIINILCCSTNEYADYNEYTKKYKFQYELINGNKNFNENRNPIFINEGDYLKYSYIFTKNSYNDEMLMIPTYPYSFSDYIRVFAHDGSPFKFPDLNSEYINESCATLTDNILNTNEDKYRNISVFNIFNEDDAKEIYSKYSLYKKGSISIKDYTTSITSDRIKDFLDYTWNFSKKLLEDYYDSNPYCKLLFKSKMDEINNKYILPSDIDEASKVVSVSIWNRSEKKFMFEYCKKNVSEIAYNTFHEKDDNYSNFYIPYIKIYNKNVEYSLFGSFFYYMQNNKLEEETEEEYQDRCIKSKSLLFLSSLPFNKKLPFDDTLKIGCVFMVPKILLLYIGGILWRERYYKNKGHDCFIYNDSIVSINEPYINAKGNKNELYKYTLIDLSTKNRVSIDNFGQKIDDFVFNLRKEIKNTLIDYFENWTNSSDGFVYISNSCEIKNEEGKAYVRSDIEKISNEWTINYRNGSYKELLENTNELVVENKKNFLRKLGPNFLNTYCSFHSIGNIGSFELLFRDNTDLSLYLNKLVNTLNVMSIGCYNVLSGGTEDVIVNKSVLKSYLSNLLKTLEKIVKNSNEEDNRKTNDISLNKDIKIAMYNYIKSIHDKWLIGCNKHDYSLEKFFNENFLFVDTFYRDIKDKLIINCDYFVNKILDAPENYSLFSFLSDLFSQHGMIFTPISHYNNWSEENTLTNMFKPFSYNDSQQTINDNTKFICMYVHEPSKNLNIGGNGSSYGFKEDSFLINDCSLQPSVFLKSENNVNGDVYGYPIPSFGVSFAKANQSYFKNINVSMDNPITTEYSAKAVGEIAKLGESSNTKVHFIGQDIYSVYSNYSYECKVEMMGCAQIQPLMYFQLTNIPMFRGTYIITKVTHEITPGNMKTIFNGFRMSKYGQPFNSLPFANLNVLYKNASNTIKPSNEYNIEDEEVYNIKNEIDYVYTNPEKIDIDSYENCGCDKNNGWDGLTDKMKRLFFSIKDSVDKYQEGIDKDKRWTICVKSGKDVRTGSNSDHNSGWAMDLQIVKNGVVVKKMQNKKELGIVFEIISKYYMSYIKQLILEFYDINNVGYDCEMIKTIHISSSDNVTTHQIFQTYEKDGKDINIRLAIPKIKWKNTNKTSKEANTIEGYKFSLQDNFVASLINESYSIIDKTNDYMNKLKVLQSLNNISKYYKNAASYYINDYYPNRMKEFKNIFTSFSNTDDVTLSYYFNLNSNKLLCDSYLSLNKSEEGFRNQKRCENIDKFKEKINIMSSKFKFNSNWLMGVMVSESGLDPSAKNKISSACGLIQFTKQYYENEYGFTLNEFMNLDASEQIDYVDRYFSYWVNNFYSKNDKWNGFNYPVDLYLTVFAPGILNNNIGNMKSSTIIFSKDVNEREYNSNSSLDISNKGYITVHDLETFLFNRIKMFAKDDDYDILNNIIEKRY